MSKMFYMLLVLAIGLAFMDPVLGQEAVADPPPPIVVEATPTPDVGIPEPPEEAPWWVGGLKTVVGTFPDINAWLIAVLVFLNGLARVLTEGLVFIAEKTNTKKDDKWASVLKRLSLWTATILGWFSLGTPKNIADKKDNLK